MHLKEIKKTIGQLITHYKKYSEWKRETRGLLKKGGNCK